ncbi:MAG TPA: helix-turn-helix domain-containing protein [Candidatus Sulfotelmatobacter sp.]|nr:helix-turn-helix domain-containing protein [Candidatus Sulfotelmatobacter sp.]
MLQFVTVYIVKLQIDAYHYSKLNYMTTQKLSIDSLPDLLTVREVAEILRVSPLTIKRWGKRGKLPAIRINSRGDRRYKKEAVLWLLGIQQKTE